MSIDTSNNAANELQKTLARVQAGVRDPVAIRQACERMDRMREELRKKIGIVDVAVELIRDARNP
jgi:hypothetical protein